MHEGAPVPDCFAGEYSENQIPTESWIKGEESIYSIRERGND